MAKFYEYSRYPYTSKEDIYQHLRATNERALALDRETGEIETWVDGQCVYRGYNHNEASKTFGNYPRSDTERPSSHVPMQSTGLPVMDCPRCGRSIRGDKSMDTTARFIEFSCSCGYERREASPHESQKILKDMEKRRGQFHTW